jgi:hypothetical protein
MAINTNVNLSPPYLNADGLMVRYGTSEAVVEKGGDVNTYGDLHVARFKVDYADVALGVDATHLYVLSYNTVLPDNCVPVWTKFTVTTAWDSTSSDVTLDFGTIKASDYTIVDADGLMAAVAKSSIDTLGAMVDAYVSDSLPAAATYDGAQLGTVLSDGPYLVTCNWNANAPTVGAGILEVYYRGA